MDIHISIIIVNFNTSELLNDCLTSISRDPQTPAHEIIVVDNHSDDTSLAMLHQHHPSVTVIANPFNAGFAAANNQAIRHAIGRYVWLLNPDTIVMPGCMTRLMNLLDNHQEIGAAGPRTWLDTDRTLEVCSLKLLTPALAKAVFTRLPDRQRTRLLHEAWERDATMWTATKPYAIDGIGGAALFTSRSILEEAGGLDERFFMGYEDTDLCTFIQQKNRRIVVHPDAEIVHLFGQAKQKPQAPKKHIYAWHTAPLNYLQKYYGTSAANHFRSLRHIDRLVRRICPSIPPGRSVSSTPDGFRLAWSKPYPSACIEWSTDPLFFDKFGRHFSGNTFLFPAPLLNRLDGNRWYWRVWLTPGGSPTQPIDAGWGIWNKYQDNS
ncbi:glycosyltransferase family 2 protein [bacterium]|nr:glycosyltransferase family 2 protein [candidate division CSSED10-310 bacterium]